MEPALNTKEKTLQKKVTINRPSDEVLKTANTEVSITDAKGRVITLRKPGVLAQYRLVEMIGDSAKNKAYMGMILPLLFVSTIDGNLTSIVKKSELEALIQQLDEEGIKSVMEGVQEHFVPQTESRHILMP
jgi:hypothetical protein